MLLRRSAVDQVGGLFDPNFFLYYEDTDLCFRLRRGGWRIFLVPQAVVLHAFSSTAPDRAEWKGKISNNSNVYFMQKYYGTNRRQHLGARLVRCLNRGDWQPVLGCLNDGYIPPVIPVPPEWHDSWLLEIGTNHFFLPAAGLLGRGPAAHLSPELWQQLPAVDFYCRLGPPRPAWLRPAIYSFRKLP
jgi:cellulose synthase/poly-beta-1,6-N-acetylglucosamine synthase-like glycosyltransferase